MRLCMKGEEGQQNLVLLSVQNRAYQIQIWIMEKVYNFEINRDFFTTKDFSTSKRDHMKIYHEKQTNKTSVLFSVWERTYWTQIL